MSTPPIFVISGGRGTSGEQLVRTALAQFQGVTVPVIIVPHVQRVEQLEDVIEQTVSTRGIIAHTLVEAGLRSALIDLAREGNAVTVDLMGPLLSQLTRILAQRPLGQPGLYRQLREDYFKRIEAIEFAVEHDDGRKPHELHLADLVLVGVSRVGKTPLSMYLSMEGWKVANVPLIKVVSPPQQLFEIDRRHVVGLTIEPGQLAAYRLHRHRRLGVPGRSTYTDTKELYEELEFARNVCHRGQFAIVDITEKQIEESATEVMAKVTRLLRHDAG
jgi:regulator of PEP synthase PpsR (kinase-PPPase family)